MFQPVFCFDSSRSSARVARAQELGCRLVDTNQVGTSVHGGNPSIVMYDNFAAGIDPVSLNHRPEFFPPEKTGVLIFRGEKKGYIRGLPNPLEAIEWFTGQKPVYFNRFTGNFRL